LFIRRLHAFLTAEIVTAANLTYGASSNHKQGSSPFLLPSMKHCQPAFAESHLKRMTAHSFFLIF
jgi:hypothetical protein